MEKKPRILVFTMNSWNSKVGSNTWESLLSRYDSENIANVYLREDVPDSKACSRYFHISERKVIKSILKRNKKTGNEVFAIENDETTNFDLQKHNELYGKMRKKRRYSLLLVREILWKLGKWKTKELDAFLDDFKPDIILHSMDGYIHLNRIVRYAIKRTGAKAVGYIWDDTFTYKQSNKLGYKFYRYFQRKSQKRLAKITDRFFAITKKTKDEADKFFNINCTVLSKPINTFSAPMDYSKLIFPIKMLYTGNLLIGRSKSLRLISDAIKKVNESDQKIILDVYTQTTLPEEELNDIVFDSCRVHGPIPQSEVLTKQKEADVLLFLEDVGKNNLTARLSFSTKITDYFSAGKCIFAVGNPDLAPIQYFKDTNSAIVNENQAQIEDNLLKIVFDAGLMNAVAKNAVITGRENHDCEIIENTFDGVINSLI